MAASGLLLLLGEERAGRGVREEVVQVILEEDGLDLVWTIAGRGESADDGAHARSRDGIDRDAFLVENLEHADGRGCLCPSARKRDPDARPIAIRPLRWHGQSPVEDREGGCEAEDFGRRLPGARRGRKTKYQKREQ